MLIGSNLYAVYKEKVCNPLSYQLHYNYITDYGICQAFFINLSYSFNNRLFLNFPRKLVNRPFADEVRLVVPLFPLADGVSPQACCNRKIRLRKLGGLPYALDERAVGFALFNFHCFSFLLLCKIQSLADNYIFLYSPHHHISRL